MTDKINPQYYQNSSGAQLIELVGVLPFSMGNAIKYVFRHEKKNGAEDLRKALWYLNDFIERPVFTTTPLPFEEVIENILSEEPHLRDVIFSLIDLYEAKKNNRPSDLLAEGAKWRIEGLFDKIEQ